MKLKTDANEDFNKSDYLSALNKYTIIVKLAEEIDFKEQLCILNSNMGLCFIKMVKYFINFFINTNLNLNLTIFLQNEDKKAIECFTKSLDYDNKYIKAYVNRMLTLNKLEDFIEALDDFNKIKEIDYNIYLKYRHMEKELNYKAEIKKKQMTEEVMGKLKEVGNSFLGLFGLSTNNFQMQQNASGGYSINFQK